MAEVLVIGKKISEMGLVNEITGEEKIPTGVVGDKAVTTGQLLTYLENNGKVQWGRIEGDITNQDDLQNQFAQQLATLQSHIQDQGNPHNVTKEQVGLGNVDNTADVDKPISNSVKSELKSLYEKGAALPYEEGVAYEENAVVVRDGVLQQWKGGEWSKIESQAIKKYLLAAGVDESELDGDYDFIMQRLAQIAVDNGWDASFVVDGDKTQKQINDDLLTRTLNLRNFPRLAGETHDTPRINRMITKANELGIRYCDIDDGDYYILASTSDTSWYGWDDGIELKSGVHVRASKAANIRALPYSYQGGTVIRAKSQYDVGWFGGKIFGERSQHLAPDGSAYIHRKNSTAYTVGQYIWHSSWGFLVTSAGTTAEAMPPYNTLNVGDTLVDGTATLEVVNKSLGEWGHNIAIYGCDRVFIDTEIVDAWGDGCLITSTQINGGTPSSNVFLRLKAYNNRRQGLSVTSCDGLYLLDGCDFSGTNGTNPQYGIDFEPNANQTVRNVFAGVIRADNNTGGGVMCYANATGSRIENINIGTLVANNNMQSSFRARYAGVDGVTIDKIVSKGCQSVGALRVDGGAKRVSVGELYSDGDYAGVSISTAKEPRVGYAEIKNSVINSSLTDVVGGEIGIIKDLNTGLKNGFAMYSCTDVAVNKIDTLSSNETGLDVVSCAGCKIGFDIKGAKSGHAVHVRSSSSNNIISGVIGDQAKTQIGGYGIYVADTSTGNRINHNIIKAQTGIKFSAGIHCLSTTSGNTVMFNEVDVNAYTSYAVGDSGDNTLEFNSGQFYLKMPTVTTNNLQSQTSLINVRYKEAGKIVFNLTTGKHYFALGRTVTDSWRPVGAADGTQDITVTT